MKRKNKAIIFPILTFLLLFGQSKRSLFAQSAPIKDDENFIQMADKFSQPQLSAEDRGGFEQRAPQKLEDFVGFLSLVGARGYAPELRDEVVKLGVALFKSEDQTFVHLMGGKAQKEEVPEVGTVQAYMEKLRADDRYQQIKGELVNVELIGESELHEEGYRGTMHFHLRLKFMNDEKVENVKSFAGELDYWILRRAKKFGQRRKLIWETKLGSVLLTKSEK